MSDYELRAARPDELADVLRLDALVWGNGADPARDRCYTEFLEADRAICAFHDGELVGVQCTVSLDLTVPGGARLPLAGATWLLVHPLHRGRGLMAVLDTAVRSDPGFTEPLYGGMPHDPAVRRSRDEYGPASRHAEWTIDLTRHRGLRHVPEDDGTLEYVPVADAIAAMREVAAGLQGVRNGWVRRKPCLDDYKYSLAHLAGASYGPITFVVHRDRAGSVDGVLAYQLGASSESQGRPEGSLRVVELLGLSTVVEAQLWKHCVDNRLVYQLVALRRPVDDPVVYRLADPRDARPTIRDDMYLTLRDVPVALSARRYARDDALVIELRDGGRYRLEGGLDGADCRPVTTTPDLTVSRAALSAAYLGDLSLRTSAGAGHVDEHTPGAVDRAAGMFTWAPAPWLQDIF
ncbi:MAG TPA: GNAT family N-acetyltransferase [Pseudonocardiaceae bacterium]